MVLATMCTLEPILEINMSLSNLFIILKTSIKFPCSCFCCNVNKPNFATCPHMISACKLLSFSSYDAVVFFITLGLSVNESSIPVHSTPSVVRQNTCVTARLLVDSYIQIQIRQNFYLVYDMLSIVMWQ